MIAGIIPTQNTAKHGQVTTSHKINIINSITTLELLCHTQKKELPWV
jgi:hypothetical protein